MIRSFESRLAIRARMTLFSCWSSSTFVETLLPDALRLRPTTLSATMPPSSRPSTMIQARPRVIPTTKPESAMPPTALTGSIATLPPAATRERPAVLRGAERGFRAGAAARERGAGRDFGRDFGFGRAAGRSRGEAAGAPISRPPRGRA